MGLHGTPGLIECDVLYKHIIDRTKYYSLLSVSPVLFWEVKVSLLIKNEKTKSYITDQPRFTVLQGDQRKLQLMASSALSFIERIFINSYVFLFICRAWADGRCTLIS